MLLQVDKICKKYGKHKALDDVSFSLSAGNIYGLIGPNGAGKTTLLRIITGILEADSGSVSIGTGGIDIEKIGYLPEERGMYKKMKTMEALTFFASLKGISKKQAKQSAFEKLKSYGLENWSEKKIEQLSKGMQQKVQFLTATLHDPLLLILDEPFSGLDPVNAQFLTDQIIASKNRGCGIILSTHRMDNIEQLCDQLLIINKGKLLINGAVEEVKRQYGK